ncbi:MAG: hypothetical protein KBD16_00780 [Candidatus Pacebacteria bacterium]|nr:hypothetical protein [Candidatus Paceibacterota bacterium]
MTTHSPQESREQFEKEVAKTTALIGWTLNSSQADADIMAALDTYTHSLITHAMQQIEAGKRDCFDNSDQSKWGAEYKRLDDHQTNAFNAATDEALTILQSLLPEQKKDL